MKIKNTFSHETVAADAWLKRIANGQVKHGRTDRLMKKDPALSFRCSRVPELKSKVKPKDKKGKVHS